MTAPATAPYSAKVIIERNQPQKRNAIGSNTSHGINIGPRNVRIRIATCAQMTWAYVMA